MIASIFTIAIAAVAGQTAVAQSTVEELNGRVRESMGGSEITVDSNGIIVKCAPIDKKYWNSMATPDICSAYPVGSRYGPPTTFKGKPMSRKIEIIVTTRDVNIAR